MMARLSPLLILGLAALLTACASSPSSTLGELPRTPQATTQQLLQQADQSDPAKAAELRLAAADQSLTKGEAARARGILEQVPLDSLKPAQQISPVPFWTEIALIEGQPQQAQQALAHPAFERLGELPVDQQIRSQTVRARTLEATGQTLAAARERIFTAPLLSGTAAKENHEAIWGLLSALPAGESQGAGGDTDLDGWLSLATAVKQAGTFAQQQRAIDSWIAQHPQHPAAKQLPAALEQLRQLADQPLTHVALLLPMQGQLASVAQALRDGFLAAHLQAQQAGATDLRIELYDSSRITSLDAVYQQAQADGVQLIIGPLEK